MACPPLWGARLSSRKRRKKRKDYKGMADLEGSARYPLHAGFIINNLALTFELIIINNYYYLSL